MIITSKICLKDKILKEAGVIMIKTKDIVKTFQNGEEILTALNRVSLEVDKGEYVGIMGPSGSGKSTFMNIIGCLDHFDSGEYFLNGRNITELSDNELSEIRNKEIGFVFQAFNLLPKLNVLENVELPMTYTGVPEKERHCRALAAIEKVGLTDRISHRPSELSGGQKQKTAIARAIINNPSVILADEPTGNLDSKSTQEIMKVFQRLNDEGVTIIMITHENDVAAHSKRLVRFFDGRIISDEKVENRIIE